MEDFLAPDWHKLTTINVDINTDIKPGFLKLETEPGWFDLKYVPIISIDDTKIIAEGVFMFNYTSRTLRFIKDPSDFLIEPYLDENKTIRNPNSKFNYKKLQEGDAVLRIRTIEVDRLRGTIVHKQHPKPHWMDLPAEAALLTYTGWDKARNCKRAKKLF